MLRELYPPILPSYVPAFNCEFQGASVAVFFKLSAYNTISEIKQAHVAVRFQSNNASALKDEYLNDIAVADVHVVDNPESTDYPYYISLSGNYLIKNGFQPGYIYKVQIRLSTVAYVKDKSSNNPSPFDSPSLSFINENLAHFSEWSTVCLLKGIIPPTIGIKELEIGSSDLENELDDEHLTLLAGDSTFTGRCALPTDSDESPKLWRMKLYQEQDDKFILIGDSDERSFNSYDYLSESSDNVIVFSHNFKRQLEDSNNYKINLEVETRNGYRLSKEYNFDVVQNINFDFYPTLTATMNNEEGYVHFTVENNTVISAVLTLRRSSALSNFEIWEDLTNTSIKNSIVNIAFDDFTVESGVVYQYGVQVRDKNHRRGVLLKSNRVMGDFEFSYLLGHSKGLSDTTTQLKLKFNNNITNFANTIIESKQDPIGSKYPFISRNGNTYYKTFSISGLISYYMDEAELFTSRKKTYGAYLDYVDSFNTSRNGIKRSLMSTSDNLIQNPDVLYDEAYDYTYEKDFRNQVMDFLYDGKPKLYKSATEGNILVRLMDISFTPNEQLGRLVYDFTATAIEIDEVTLDNLNKYNIQSIEPFSADLQYTSSHIGQLNSWETVFNAGVNIHTLINRKHHIGETWEDVKYSGGDITYLKISFESPPYLIDMRSKRPAGNTVVPSEWAVMGWLINYSGKTILVTYPNNIYELKGENVRIKSNLNISFPAKVEATIDYVIEIEQEPAEWDKVLTKISFSNKMGQIYKSFSSNENFINTILYRYLYDEDKWVQKVNNIYSLDIEAEPGTVIYLRESLDTGIRRFVFNFTGRLYFEPDEFSVSFLRGYFWGRNIRKTELREDYGEVSEYPINPMYLDYCKIDDTHYVYYNGEWYEADYVVAEDSYDIKCPVDGIVNYYVQTMKGIYEQT